MWGGFFAFHLAPDAIAAPAVKGDVAGWNEINAAFNKLHALRSYRSKTVTDGETTITDFVPPNYHAIVSGHQSYETYVGNETVTVNPPGSVDAGCKRRSGATPPAEFDLSTIPTDIAVKHNPNTSIGGVPVHAFSFSGDTVTSRLISRWSGDVYISGVTGLPRRIVFKNTGPLVRNTSTTDYYDYGTKITITAPC